MAPWKTCWHGVMRASAFVMESEALGTEASDRGRDHALCACETQSRGRSGDREYRSVVFGHLLRTCFCFYRFPASSRRSDRDTG